MSVYATSTYDRKYTNTMQRLEIDFCVCKVEVNKFSFPHLCTFLKVSDDFFEVYSSKSCKRKIGVVYRRDGGTWCYNYSFYLSRTHFFVMCFVDFLNLYGYDLLKSLCMRASRDKNYTDTMREIESGLCRYSDNIFYFPRHCTFLKVSDDLFEVYHSLECNIKLGEIFRGENSVWDFHQYYNDPYRYFQCFVDFLNLYGYDFLEKMYVFI